MSPSEMDIFRLRESVKKLRLVAVQVHQWVPYSQGYAESTLKDLNEVLAETAWAEGDKMSEQEYSKLIAAICKHLVAVEDIVYKFQREDKNLEYSECKEVCSAINSCLELLEDVE